MPMALFKNRSRRWWGTLAGLLALLVVAPTMVYVFGGPGAREAIDAAWNWIDGALRRLQMASWIVAAGLALVSYRSYLADRAAKDLEQARWAAEQAASGNDQQKRFARQAINDLVDSAKARGEEPPALVEEVKETLRSDIVNSVVVDTEAIRTIREDEVDEKDPEDSDVDDPEEGER
jgi:hypothetical protein